MTEDHASGVDEKLSEFRAILLRRYGQAVYNSWMSDLFIDQLSDDCVTLATTSDIKAERLNQQYRPAMQTVWNDRVCSIKSMFIVSKPALRESSRMAAKKAFGRAADSAFASALKSNDAFEGKHVPRPAAAPRLPNDSVDHAGVDHHGSAQSRGTRSGAAQPFSNQARLGRTFENGGYRAEGRHQLEGDHRSADLRATPFDDSRHANAAAHDVSSVSNSAGGRDEASMNETAKIDFETLASPVDEDLTFDAFAIGASNELAYAASRRIFLGGARRDIVYIHGASGCGKSHLLSAMAHEWAARYPDKPVSYFSYTAMRDGCSSAALSNSLHAFHDMLKSQHLILIDDIHLLKTCKRTQEEILNLANIFPSTKRQLVIAGECSPAELVELDFNKRLADRLAGGLSASVAPGDEALRFDVLKKRLMSEPVECTIGDEILHFIAREFSNNIRVAIGALNQLVLFYGQKDVVVDLDAARERLKCKLADRPRPATIESALEVSAEVFNLKVEDLQGRAQPQAIVRGRHAFVMVGREALKESFPRLGKALKRDHTTAMSGYDRAQALYERDDNFKSAVDKIRSSIGVPV